MNRIPALAGALALLLCSPLQAGAKTYHAPRAVQQAVCDVFGRYCLQAMSVVRCETGGTYSTRAANGQYLGLFQMGSHERATYGHGRTARLQARAAYRYFVASGKDWSPWSCKP